MASYGYKEAIYLWYHFFLAIFHSYLHKSNMAAKYSYFGIISALHRLHIFSRIKVLKWVF